MSAILFGVTIPTEQVAVAILALVTAALLFNIKRYFARQPHPRGYVRTGEETKYPTAREISQKNVRVKQESMFTGGVKPEVIARWEVEFFELTRQMTAQIDTKMSALSALSIDAAKICQRMEILLERLDKAIANPTARPMLSQTPISTEENSPLYSGNLRESSSNELPDTSVSSSPLESKQEKKALFPRLSSLSGLEFSDYGDLASLGADIFTETPLETKTYNKTKGERSFPESSLPTYSPIHTSANPLSGGMQPPPLNRPSLELKPQYPNTVQPPRSGATLGELLLQEKNHDQTAKSRSIPHSQRTASGAEHFFR